MRTLTTLTAITVSVMLLGCGSDETVSETPEPAPGAQQASAPAPTRQAAPKKKAQSVLDRIDAALDRGNYMGAVDIAIKGGKNAQENMSNLRYVQEELGDPMARGDAKAHQAYQKLNAFYIMRYQR